MEIGELEGEKVFLKYGKYGRCISCGGTVAQVRSWLLFPPSASPARRYRKSCVLERVYHGSVVLGCDESYRKGGRGLF